MNYSAEAIESVVEFDQETGLVMIGGFSHSIQEAFQMAQSGRGVDADILENLEIPTKDGETFSLGTYVRKFGTEYPASQDG